MNKLAGTTSLALHATEVARRFERVCRRRIADCRVEALVGADGMGLELRVAPLGKGRAESLSVRGLDGDSWADSRGMESLARVVSVWVDPPANQLEDQASRPPHLPSARRPGSTWLQRLVSPLSKPSPRNAPS